MKTPSKILLLLTLTAASIAFSQASLVIGSFDSERSGKVSISEGDYFQQFRAVLTANFSNVTFTGFTTLTASNLACLDVLVLAPGTTHNTSSTALSTNEQAALLDYVRQGGGTVLLADNDSYAANAIEEETALLSPLGITACCTLNGRVDVPVQLPALHLVTSGPFGTTTSFSQFFPGSITSLGPYATGLATNALGVALAVINLNAISSGSGRVVIFSDGNTFADDEDVGGITENQILLLNIVAWCRRIPQPQPRLTIEIRSSHIVLRWPTNATGFHLQSAGTLDAAIPWTPVGSSIVVIGSENVVTNDITETTQFYRLVCP